MRAGRRGLSNEGVGGFLESILAVMAVITASSLFLVMLSVGAMPDSNEDVDLDELLDELREDGLWPLGEEKIDVEGMGARFNAVVLPQGVSFIHLTCRAMGDKAPLMTFGALPPDGATVLADQAPALLDIDGRAVPAMLEVLVW